MLAATSGGRSLRPSVRRPQRPGWPAATRGTFRQTGQASGPPEGGFRETVPSGAPFALVNVRTALRGIYWDS